jgi:hypothetical protein
MKPPAFTSCLQISILPPAYQESKVMEREGRGEGERERGRGEVRGGAEREIGRVTEERGGQKYFNLTR